MKQTIILTSCLVLVAGCNGFGGYPTSPVMGNDAGIGYFMNAGDGGMPSPQPDAAPSGTDAGNSEHADSGETTEAGNDAGTIVAEDAGAPCDPDTVELCLTRCFEGYIACNPASGAFDGECLPLVSTGLCDDAGTLPATDAGVDAATSADAGTDAYVAPTTDAGSDAGTDAGGPTRTVTFQFTVDPTLLYSSSAMDFLEELATTGATHADAESVHCESGSGVVTESGTTWFRCVVTRPVGTDFYFVGSFMTRYNATYGSADSGVWATFSSWNPGASHCGDLAETRGVTWAITASDGRSLLPATGIPEIVQPRTITEDGHAVCRGHLVF